MGLVVIDGPNLFNKAASALPKNDSFAKQYLLNHLDMDSLVRATLGLDHEGQRDPVHGMVIFHSHRRLGPGPLRFSQEETRAFWLRQGCTPGVSTHPVVIEKDDQEQYEGTCDKCQAPVMCTTRKEKGLDTSIATYLFETMHAWESVAIFSSDVDFVPVVAALRRRGKRVFVCTPESERTALVQASQSRVPLDLDYVERDRALVEFARPGGYADQLVRAAEAEPGFGCAVSISRAFSGPPSLRFCIASPADGGVAGPRLARAWMETLGDRARIATIEGRSGELVDVMVPLVEGGSRQLERACTGSAWERRFGDYNVAGERAAKNLAGRRDPTPI